MEEQEADSAGPRVGRKTSKSSKRGVANIRGGNRSGAGRKTVPIDLVELEKLSVLQATDQEVALWFDVTTRTIENRRKKDAQFRGVMERGRAKGRISVRRAQMKLLESGNATMGVWLGKQLLGQRDVTPVELSGPNGKPVQFSLEVIDEILSIAKKSGSGSKHS